MFSAARLAANRRNCLRSTGPRTSAGKARALENTRRSTGPRTPGGKARAAANARLSTGPRTPEGKARSARNAIRHGLSIPAACDPRWAARIRAFAQLVAGTDADAERRALAWRVAQAQIEVFRARLAKCRCGSKEFLASGDIARLAAIDRYEGRALARRNRAIRALDAAALGPREQPELAAILRDTNQT